MSQSTGSKRKNKLFKKWIYEVYNRSRNGVKDREIYLILYREKIDANVKETTSRDIIIGGLFNLFLSTYKDVPLKQVAAELNNDEKIQSTKIKRNRNKIIKRVAKKTGKDISESFYVSEKWLALKRKVHNTYRCGCMKCGVSGVELHVDHIFPRSTHKEFEYSIHNLQILCKKCNIEKSNKNTIDYRTTEQKLKCSRMHT